MSARPDRIVALEGAHNIRDLGGLPVGDGVVRSGLIFRSEYPGFLAVDDAAAVRALGLRTVVDLRSRTEVGQECVDWAAYDVRHVRHTLSAGGETSWQAHYHAYLVHRPETLVLAVQQVLDPDNHPVLFHCAAGKDRTGVIAALVLATLGVAADAIVEDYLLSGDGLTAIMPRLRSSAVYAAMLGDADDESQRPQEATMRALLAWLEEHGGARVWLVDNGVPAEEIARFRDWMVTGSPLA